MSKSDREAIVEVRHPGDREATGIAVRYRAGHGEQSARPGILWLNGFKSVMTATKASALDQWAENQGRAFLRFDYGGHGESSGNFEDGTITRWLDEAAAVFETFAAGPQILVGSSMGGWISLLLNRKLRRHAVASGATIAALVLIAPAVDMTRRLIWDQLPGDLRAELEQTGKFARPSQYDEEPYIFTKSLIDDGDNHLLMDNPPATGCPVRILHGMGDPDVPWALSMELVEKLPDQDVILTLIKNGDHRLSREQDIVRLIATIDSLS